MTKKKKTLLLCGIILAVAVLSGAGLLIYNLVGSKVGNVLDVAWYDEEGTEFTISTADELYELAALSEYYDFKGQTIKLGADITVNEGNAEDWLTRLPNRMWEPIWEFAGTFDGQGHTISGLCGDGTRYTVNGKTHEIDMVPTGLFARTKASCVIKDFRLVNTLFVNDVDDGVGSITATGSGTFERIYSSAILYTYKNHGGGIIGKINAMGNTTISNCWFDGEIHVEGTFGRYIGGMVGRVYAAQGQNKIEHCLSTGTFTSPVKDRGINIGGLIGNIDTTGKITVTDSFSAGSISNEYGISVGSSIGCNQGNLMITDTYSSTEAYKNVVGAVIKQSVGAPMGYPREMLIGEEAYKWTTLDFKNHWAIQKDNTPMLQCFADEIPSTKGLKKAFDTSWFDPAKSQYTISTIEEMYGLAILSHSNNFSGKTVKLGKDLVVNSGNAADWRTKAPATRWLPISSYAYPFAGTFDGQMNTISGVYLNTIDKNGGLFESTASSANIKNLRLENSYFESSEISMGSIIGYARGKVNTVYSNAIMVSHAGYTGGIIGQVASDVGVQVENTWFDGHITALGNTPTNRRTAGIIGYAYKDSAITNCLNTGTIDATAYTAKNSATSPVIAPCVGGFIGDEGKAVKVTIKDSINAGLIKYNEVATAGYGPAIGYSSGTTILNGVYATNESCEQVSGGNVTGQVISMDAARLAGMNGYVWTHLDFENIWAVAKESTPVIKAFASEVPSVASAHRMVDVSWYDDTSKNVFTIDSKEDLYGLWIVAHNTNFEGKTVKVGKNITVNTGNAAEWAGKAPAYEWESIGSSKIPFSGTFDGGKRTISGLYQNTDERFGGLFSTGNEKTKIKNVIIANSYFNSTAEGNADIAAVLGRSLGGTLDTIYVKENVTVVGNGDRVAGIVGLTGGETKTIINNCWNAASIINVSTVKQNTGGIVGLVYENTAVVTNCLNTGNIDASASKAINKHGNYVPMVGGIVGQIYGTGALSMRFCLNVGQIKVPNSEKIAGYGALLGYPTGKVLVSDVYATKESCSIPGLSKSSHIMLNTSEILGYKGFQWTTLDFNKYWAVVVSPEGTPILKSFAPSVPSLNGYAKLFDTSWYDESKSEFVLKDMQDLYGFYQLSQTKNFRGKTVKLGKNITVNGGNAADWEATAPEHIWKSIGSADSKFAGTFDGQGYTISGLYQNTDTRFGGIFADVASTAVVKNVKLSNSYFKSTLDASAAFAAVIGRANGGTFDSIYVDDTVSVTACGGHIGGIIGLVNGDTTINNCWNAANVTNTSTKNDATGGIVGCRFEGKLTITHCMNSGVIDASAYNKKNDKGNIMPYVAGLVGYTNSKDTVIEDSLNTGKVLIGAANNGYGSLVGYHTAKDTIKNTYGTKESSKQTGASKAAGGVLIEEANLAGYGSFAYTTLDFDKYWAVVDGPTPVLQTFADKDSVLSVAGADAEWFRNASGTETDPYTLTDKEDLYGFQKLSTISSKFFAGKTITLGNDIIVNEGSVSEWDNPKTWTPIGKNEPFAGTFNGGLYTISGLYCNETTKHAGLFGQLAATASVKNLKIANSYFNSSATDEAKIGAVVGYSLAKELSSIYVDSTVTVSGQKNYVGGIAGMIYGAADATNEMSKCWSAATVENKTSDANNSTGGLVGNVHTVNLNMTDCLHTGIVKADKVSNAPAAGGFVGRAQGILTINKSLNLGTVSVQSESASMTVKSYGSYVGRADKAVTLTNAYMADNVNVSIGYPTQASEAATITTAENLKGDKAKTVLIGFDFMNNWKTVENSTPEILFTLEKIVDMDWYVDDAAGRVYELKTPAQLKGFMVLSKEHNFAGQTIRLKANIALNDQKLSELDPEDYGLLYKWEPIGKISGTSTKAFAGTFDGNNKTISGIYCNESTRFVGLFGDIGAATIKNLTIDNSRFESTLASGNGNIGIITGRSGAATFENIHITEEVQLEAAGGQWVGGISGMTNGNTTMTDCISEAAITSSGSNVGGLIGIAYKGTTTMTRCMNGGTITKTSGNGTGGLIGDANAGTLTISKCINAGTITTTGGAWIGGLLGRVEGSVVTLTDCMNSGAMNCSGNSVIGGIVGRGNKSFTMTRVLNVGSITGAATYTGAMVGYVKATEPVTCADSYYAEKSVESTVKAVGSASPNKELNTSADCTALKETDITGIDGTTAGKMGEFFANGLNAWTHVEGGTPVLSWIRK